MSDASLFKALVLSAAHLPGGIHADLNGYSGVIAEKLPGGWHLWVPTGDLDARAAEHQVPAQIVAIWRYARQHGCRTVLFDTDQPIL